MRKEMEEIREKVHTKAPAPNGNRLSALELLYLLEDCLREQDA